MRAAGPLNTDEQYSLVSACPLCGGKIEQMEIEQDNFHNYFCTDCGLNWQSYVNPQAQPQQDPAQHWMLHLSQD
jgi:predicted RNA-binding Zn-ribbon protein involved in translation (DUF1610 family)